MLLGPREGIICLLTSRAQGGTRLSGKKWMMGQDNGTPATGRNSMPQCHPKTTKLLQELHERTEREAGDLFRATGTGVRDIP